MNFHRFFRLSLFVMLTVAASMPAAAEERADTRVLIDISGSMKQNDPNNLRGSALRLLVGLLPKGNRAGVWTFGQYSNMLIPLGEVNESWKKRAKLFSEKISSPGQFTNIEEVLSQATADWKQNGQDYSRNLILLTDGMVDISKSASKNEASRKRILDRLAPQIKERGGVIHTIALSDRADHELMKSLSSMTGGWYEQVNSADELQRVFLRMFEKVSKPDSVPLSGNRFTLDSSISEATILVFNKPGAPPARLISPDGKSYDANALPEGFTWHRDLGYDLVTLSEPQAGEWTIEADMDPDNRVMVVTDLKMQTSSIPNRIAVGESVPVNVHFTEKDTLITKPEFLEIVTVSAAQSFAGAVAEAVPLSDDGIVPDTTAGDGKFSILLGNQSSPGKLDLVISADGRSFVRERRQSTEVVLPARLDIEDSEIPPQMKLDLQLDAQVVQVDSVNLDAWMEDMTGQRTDIVFQPAGDGLMSALIDREEVVGRQFAFVNVNGKTLSGNDFAYQPEQFDVNGLKAPEAEPVKPAEPEPAPEPAAEKTPEPAIEPEPVTEPETETETPVEEPEEETDWLTVGLVIGLGNLLLVGIGGGIWWFVRKRSEDDDLMLLDEEQVDAEDIPEPAADSQPDTDAPAADTPPAPDQPDAAGEADKEDEDDDIVITGADDDLEEQLGDAGNNEAKR